MYIFCHLHKLYTESEIARRKVNEIDTDKTNVDDVIALSLWTGVDLNLSVCNARDCLLFTQFNPSRFIQTVILLKVESKKNKCIEHDMI